LTALETAQSWATLVAASATTVAIFIGGGWALWRYVLPRPFEPHWEVEACDCWVRRLPSGKHLYTANTAITNASSAPYTVDRWLYGIFFPANKEFEEFISESESALANVKLVEYQAKERFPPRVRRIMSIMQEGDSTLHHTVVVAWKVCYRRPRWLGLFGERPDTKNGVQFVPVDAQSLALYSQSDNTRPVVAAGPKQPPVPS
jgi:hypothetical protein